MNQQSFSIALVVLLIGGCNRPTAEKRQHREPTVKADNKSQEVKHDINSFKVEAEALIANFQKSLKHELSTAMKEGGPVAAIAVCSAKAPAIAKNAAKHGLTIRRISTKYRNPQNVPTKTEMEILSELTPEAPTKQLNSTFYRGIFVQPLCLTCHGKTDTLPPSVLSTLAQRYPQDKAVDYSLGELRGAFVVEKVNEQATER